MSTVTSATVTELRDNLIGYLRRVAAGEVVVVTRYLKPIAVLRAPDADGGVPLPAPAKAASARG